MYKPVNEAFFQAPVLQLAEKLLGQYIVHDLPAGRVVVRIVETEAYHGPEDQAAHSYNNRRTKRTEVMFGKPGFVYTYQMHTHTLMNVVSGPIDIPHAVLIRAAEPIEGIDIMKANRPTVKKIVDMTNGPGKLAKAIGVTSVYYGHYWGAGPLFIAAGNSVKSVGTSPRVGIGNSGEAVHYPWRFFDSKSPFVSKYRK